MKSDTTYTVGLTGGIASGKSSVTRILEKLDVAIVDADLVAREVVAPGSPALKALSIQIDNSILLDNGELNRPHLRKIIFDNPAIRKRVESILHPAIRKRSYELVEQHAQAGEPYIVCAVPLLVEAGLMGQYDRIAVVDVSEETQIRRIMARDDSTHENAVKILESQATRSQRLAVADDVINNEGSLEELDSRIRVLHQRYLKLASKKMGTDHV